MSEHIHYKKYSKSAVDYINTFKCEDCGKILNKEDTVFIKTSYGHRWLCKECDKKEKSNSNEDKKLDSRTTEIDS